MGLLRFLVSTIRLVGHSRSLIEVGKVLLCLGASAKGHRFGKVNVRTIRPVDSHRGSRGLIEVGKVLLCLGTSAKGHEFGKVLLCPGTSAKGREFGKVYVFSHRPHILSKISLSLYNWP